MPEPKRLIDIHSHIIFGADDGAQSLDEAIELLKLDRDEGAYAVFPRRITARKTSIPRKPPW